MQRKHSILKTNSAFLQERRSIEDSLDALDGMLDADGQHLLFFTEALNDKPRNKIKGNASGIDNQAAYWVHQDSNHQLFGHQSEKALSTNGLT